MMAQHPLSLRQRSNCARSSPLNFWAAAFDRRKTARKSLNGCAKYPFILTVALLQRVTKKQLEWRLCTRALRWMVRNSHLGDWVLLITGDDHEVQHYWWTRGFGSSHRGAIEHRQRGGHAAEGTSASARSGLQLDRVLSRRERRRRLEENS